MALRAPLTRIVVLALLGSLSGGCAQAPVQAPSTHIRFYTTNSYNQLSELSLIPNRDEPGCHNLLLALDIHRVAQVGFKACAVYAQDDCSIDSVLTMRWSGKRSRTDANKNQPTTEMTPGALWLFALGREAAVASWHCTPKA